jgi:hypothetical protein
MRHLSLLVSFFILFFCNCYAQVPVGTWQQHLCHSNVSKIMEVDNKIYCASEYGYFIFNTNDNSYKGYSTVDGMSDLGINSMAYNSEKDIVFFSYSSGNIDLLNNGDITNIPDLKNKVLNYSKGANSVYFNGSYAYCCHNFGIIVVNLDKNEIKDTYEIGSSSETYAVYSLIIKDGYFYAATSKGLFKAPVSDGYLSDYSRWTQITDFPNPSRKISNIVLFEDQILMNVYTSSSATDTIYVYDGNLWSAKCSEVKTVVQEITVNDDKVVITGTGYVYVYDKDLNLIFTYNHGTPKSAMVSGNYLYIGDDGMGLVKQPLDGSDYSYYFPYGPASNSVWNMKASGNSIIATAGKVNASWSPTSSSAIVFKYSNYQWYNIYNSSSLDYISIAGDPLDESTFYVGSWGKGLYEYKNDTLYEHYTNANSSIQNLVENQDYMFIGGINFDNDNNMWLSNELVSSPFSVMKTDGTWKSFALSSYLNNVPTIGAVLPDDYGDLWVILPRSYGMFIFDYNNTIDDESDDEALRFKPQDVYGSEISNVLCMAKDNDGSIWVGTESGVVVYSDPSSVIDGETAGYQPRIPRNDGSGLADALLGTQSVTCMAIDGAGRKWFGTESGGAFLISADGTSEIKNFNTSNSPLFSDYVRAIAIQPESGTVFFGTEKGIISYREAASEGQETQNNAYAFPNPVRPDYTGNVTITGLVENSSVKITDVSGSLVYQTTSLGGTASWNCKNRKGDRVASGVYLIYLTNDDGTLTNVIKLLVMH